MRRAFQRIALWLFHAVVVRPVLYGLIGARIRRRGLIPEGPCLVVANHNSHLDAAALMSLFSLRRLPQVHPVAASDYFSSSWLKRTMAMGLMNGIPIARKSGGGKDPLAPLIEAIGAGCSLILFPEGSRGEAGVVAPFRSGVGVIVRALPGLLVVPVYLSGPERIWPRGHRVPVPLALDVHVGRPRVYDASAEARQIAERVRDDVLALAPPPPPMPGVDKPLRPRRVIVCGIDEIARHRIYRTAVQALGTVGETRGIGKSSLIADSRGVREATSPQPRPLARAALALAARLLGVERAWRGERFLALVERARMAEALERAAGTRFVVEEGSALIDLPARAEARSRGLGLDDREVAQLLQQLIGVKRTGRGIGSVAFQRAPGIWLIHLLDLARPPVPDLLILVHASPGRVASRELTAGDPNAHDESEEFLARLAKAYAHVVSVLRRGRRIERLDLVIEGDDLRDAEFEVQAACCRLSESPNPGPQSTGRNTGLE